ncbi:MAG: hypothetical protein LC130_16610 [Bryobacterales bacterium]|nr:hypothetical protein [Bryobacterales bacterium]
MPEPANETSAGPVTVAQVRAEFEKLLKDRTHMGVRHFLGDLFLEPRNPFERERRRPKKWVVVFGVLALLALLIAYSFHVR